MIGKYYMIINTQNVLISAYYNLCKQQLNVAGGYFNLQMQTNVKRVCNLEFRLIKK